MVLFDNNHSRSHESRTEPGEWLRRRNNVIERIRPALREQYNFRTRRCDHRCYLCRWHHQRAVSPFYRSIARRAEGPKHKKPTLCRRARDACFTICFIDYRFVKRYF